MAILKSVVLLAVVVMTSACASTGFTDRDVSDLHKRVLTLDTHVDISPKNFTPERHMGQRLETQVDLVKMEEGGLDGAFFIVYVGQGALDAAGYEKAYQGAMEKFVAIRRMTESLNPYEIGLAVTPDEVESIAASGRKVAMIGVENAYSLGPDLSRVKMFHDLGARYVSITHNGHNQFGDANYPLGDDPDEMFGGLSPLGKELVEKLNALGIMVDISHASKKTALDVIAKSKAPIIASHSAMHGLVAHSRNLDDELLDALKDNGGVVQVVGFRSYLKEVPPNKMAALNRLADKYGLPHGDIWAEGDLIFGAVRQMPGEQRGPFFSEMRKINADYPQASVADLVDHIDYAVARIGIDHVGISSDFDGGGGIDGWSDASETYNVTRELIRRGYSEENVRKLWGGNLLRVWREVEAAADSR